MTRPSPHPLERSFPWGPALLLLGGACWLGSFAPPAWVAARVTQGSGVTAGQLAVLLPGWLRVAGTVLLTTGVVSWLFRERLRPVWVRAASVLDRPCTRTAAERRWFLLLIAGVVLLQDWPSLSAGYFESDDFSLLNDDRRLPLWELPQTTHNDHVIALLRLELRAMHAVFGVWAPAYNAAVMLSFIVLLWSGTLLLIENGVGRLATGLAALLCATWTAWGVFTTGAYILQAYMQIATCGALALLGWSRWRRIGRVRDLWLTSVATGVSVWLNVSGFYVPCALAAYVVLDASCRGELRGVGSDLWKGRVPLAVLAAAVLGAAIFTAWAYSRPESSGLLTLTNGRHTPETFLRQFASFLGTLLLSLVIPLPHHLARASLLIPAVAAALVVATGATWVSIRALDPGRRGLLCALIVTLLGVAAMTCLGRPAFEFDMIWPAKYTGPGIFWLCLALAPVADGLRARLPSVSGVGWLRAGLLCAAFACTGQWTADALCASGLPYFQYDVTRRSALREHRRERAAVRALSDDLQPVFAIPGPLAIPNLDGELICRQYPALEFTWGEQPSLAVLAEVITGDPGRVDYLERPGTSRRRERSMRIVDSVRDSTTPEFLDLLETHPRLRTFWLGPMTVSGDLVERPPDVAGAREFVRRDAPADANSETAAGDAGGWSIGDSGTDWDPEQRPVAWLRLEDRAEPSPIALQLEFRGRRFGESPRHMIAVPATAGDVLVIDLLQLNGYALDSRILDVQIVASDTGRKPGVGETEPP